MEVMITESNVIDMMNLFLDMVVCSLFRDFSIVWICPIVQLCGSLPYVFKQPHAGS